MAVIVGQRHQDDVGPEPGAILPDMPAFHHEVTGGCSALQLSPNAFFCTGRYKADRSFNYLWALVAISGSGSYVNDGDKNSWGNKDRDALYLNYTIDFSGVGVNLQYSTMDTLVVRDRGVKVPETFTPVLK